MWVQPGVPPAEPRSSLRHAACSCEVCRAAIEPRPAGRVCVVGAAAAAAADAGSDEDEDDDAEGSAGWEAGCVVVDVVVAVVTGQDVRVCARYC